MQELFEKKLEKLVENKVNEKIKENNERSARSIKIEEGGDLYNLLMEMNNKLDSIYRQSSANNSHIENGSRGSQ